MLSEKATAILRCPKCFTALRSEQSLVSCKSHACAAQYQVLDGVPILLDASQTVFDARQDGKLSSSSDWKSKLKRNAMRWLPSLDLNMSGADNMAKLRRLLESEVKEPILLNIGGKHPTSATASLCAHFDCIECDLVIRPRTSLIGDPQGLPLADCSVDAVLIDGMLEHLPDPFKCVAEIHRVLKPSGLVYSDTPFMLQVHGGALDLHRFTQVGHRRLFRQFEEVSSGITSGPGVALSYSLQFMLLSFFRSAWTRAAIEVLCRLTLFWIKYLDLIVRDNPGAADAAHGLFFLGRRQDTAVEDILILQGYAGATKTFLPLAADRASQH